MYKAVGVTSTHAVPLKILSLSSLVLYARKPLPDEGTVREVFCGSLSPCGVELDTLIAERSRRVPLSNDNVPLVNESLVSDLRKLVELSPSSSPALIVV